MRRMLLAFALLCLISVPAFAEKATLPHNYVSLKFGAYLPQSSDLEDFGSGFNGEIALGRRFSRMGAGEIGFAGEFGLGYFQTEADSSGVDVTLGNWTETDKITVIPVTLTMKAAVNPVGTNAELFAGVGLGFYLASLEVDQSTSLSGNESFSDDDTTFGFHFVAGGNYNIDTNFFIGGEFKYLWAKASFSGTAFGIPQTLDAKLDGMTLTANIGYRF